jgi:hypothetical protein
LADCYLANCHSTWYNGTEGLSLYAEADGDLEMSGCLNAMHKTKSLSKEEKYIFYEILEYADII